MRVIIDDGAYVPTRAHKTDAGLDLYSPVDKCVFPRSSVVIDTGVHIELPANTVGMIKSKSGLYVNHGLTSDGVIDEGYTGSIKVKLLNHTDDMYKISKGDKISQLVILPILLPDVDVVKEFDKETDRGNNGFGSTGK
jgi:dUTP pyrophosphatase